MSEEAIDLIHVDGEHTVDLKAKSARLHASVQGSTVVTGGAAIKQAKELRALSESLREAGLPEGAITLRGMTAVESGGILGRSSSVTYALRIDVEDLDRLPDALGALTSTKNASLNHLEWIFDDDTAARAERTAAAARDAQSKARALAAALGQRLLGVHRFSAHTGEGSVRPAAPGASEFGGASYAKRRAVSVDVGFEMSSFRVVNTYVQVAYRTAPIDDAGGRHATGAT